MTASRARSRNRGPDRDFGGRFVVFAALLVVVATACSGGSDNADGADAGATAALIATDEDRGSFSTPCELSHSAEDDPIVHAGHSGMSHLHDFFGATTTGARADAESLLAGPTTCRSLADHSAYWAPALLDAQGARIPPIDVLAYYRVPVGADATQVEAPPNGLEMIAGNSDATAAQDTDTVAWRCGFGADVSASPPSCGSGTDLFLVLVFEPCWNGEDLASDDHRSHLAPLDADGGCPADHPVLLPELTMEIRYPTASDAAGPLSLASGPATGGHGDALMAWEDEFVAREVETCLRGNRTCDVVSERSRIEVDNAG